MSTPPPTDGPVLLGTGPVLNHPLRQQLLLLYQRQERLDLHRRHRPSDWYRPHPAGQRQFHQARHIVRCLFPGNGFGKTTAAGQEVNWWVTHRHPYQPIPRRALIVIWCCETFKQFTILRHQLEAECFDRPWTYNQVDHVYTWMAGDYPGSQMFLVSGDSSWTHIQGINPDLVIFDEEPPEALWNEMKMRRRGLRKTRYVFAATATQGLTWMHRELYLPWREQHGQLGLSEPQAMVRQTHPRLWVWARGGIVDNPGADAGDRDWYQSQTFNSEAERQVRLTAVPDADGEHTYEVRPRRVYLVMKMTTQGIGRDGRIKKGMFRLPPGASSLKNSENSYVDLKPIPYPHVLACDGRDMGELRVETFNVIVQHAGALALGFPLDRLANSSSTDNNHSGRG